MSDLSNEITTQILQAAEQNSAVRIQGGNSKAFYNRALDDSLEMIDVSGHTGVVNYEPTELVLTARAGTTIGELSETLAEKNQHLAFDPPMLGGRATIGGTLASGFSGPCRPYLGSTRDHVLGTHIVNGNGAYLRFGGEVMKNVAGYDVARLMVGAMGTLGVIMQVSLKVLPKPQSELTLCFELTQDDALSMMHELGDSPTPVSGACFDKGKVFVRLSGSEVGVSSASKTLGGERVTNSETIWTSLREFSHSFFDTELPIWRLGLPALANPVLSGDKLIDWGGQQWWLRSDAPPKEIRFAAAKAGGHATLFKGGDRTGDIFHPLSDTMMQLHEKVRLSFDPKKILNPGVQYPS